MFQSICMEKMGVREEQTDNVEIGSNDALNFIRVEILKRSYCALPKQLCLKEFGVRIPMTQSLVLTNSFLNEAVNRRSMDYLDPLLQLDGKFGLGLSSVLELIRSFDADGECHLDGSPVTTFSMKSLMKVAPSLRFSHRFVAKFDEIVNLALDHLKDLGCVTKGRLPGTPDEVEKQLRGNINYAFHTGDFALVAQNEIYSAIENAKLNSLLLAEQVLYGGTSFEDIRLLLPSLGFQISVQRKIHHLHDCRIKCASSVGKPDLVLPLRISHTESVAISLIQYLSHMFWPILTLTSPPH